MIDIKVKCRNCGTFTRIEDDDLKRVYQQGGADAIEEYKCKTCIHWRKYGGLKESCEVFDWQSRADDFCSFHETKE